jgi:excisionase family DNA binding protein
MELVITTKTELKELISEAINSVSHNVKPNEDQPDLIDKIEVSKLLNISYSTVDNYRRKGLLKSYRIGNKVRFKRSEVIDSVTKKTASL